MDTNTHGNPGLSLTARETLSNPQWARMPRKGERLSGIGRSRLYELAAEGRIRTRAVGKMRFVFIPSLIALIENG